MASPVRSGVASLAITAGGFWNVVADPIVNGNLTTSWRVFTTQAMTAPAGAVNAQLELWGSADTTTGQAIDQAASPGGCLE